MESAQYIQPMAYSKEQAAAALNTSLATLNRLIAAGKIDTLKIGRTVRIEDSAIQAFKNQSTKK